jgi:BlaI family transcriptional regulator, penicillinase repressor
MCSIFCTYQQCLEFSLLSRWEKARIEGVYNRRFSMPRFTEGELEVMQILWEGGEQKPAEIQARFPREIKNPSLRSYLTILLEKGHVVRRRVGKAYFYRAKTRRQSTFRAMLDDLIRVHCSGSIETLVCQLIRTHKLSKEDLLELKRIAEELPLPIQPSVGARREAGGPGAGIGFSSQSDKEKKR